MGGRPPPKNRFDAEIVDAGDLARRLHAESPFTLAESKLIVETVFGMIVDTLASGRHVRISRFGVFYLTARSPLDPHLAEYNTPIDAPRVKFVASRTLEQNIAIMRK